RTGARVRPGEAARVRTRPEYRPVRPAAAVQYRRFLQRLQGRTAGAVDLPAIWRSRALRAASERRRCEGQGRGSRDLRHADRRVAVRRVRIVSEMGLEMREPPGGGPGERSLLERSGGDQSAGPEPDRVYEGAGARRRPI